MKGDESMKKITLVLKNPRLVIYYLGSIGLLNWMPDKLYLRVMFKLKTGQSLNLNNPITFNEKLQWLKLYNRKDEYTTMVDKYAAKKQQLAEKDPEMQHISGSLIFLIFF